MRFQLLSLTHTAIYECKHNKNKNMSVADSVDPNTGIPYTTDLACICNEQTQNTLTYTHSHTQMQELYKHTEVGRGCGPPVAQRTTAASGRQFKVLFFGSGLLLATLNNSL